MLVYSFLIYILIMVIAEGFVILIVGKGCTLVQLHSGVILFSSASSLQIQSQLCHKRTNG